MEAITILSEALERIYRMSQGCPTETGGILGGTTRQPLVFVAGEPGRGAVKTAASFRSDPEQDRAELRQARSRYGENLQLLGYWHKHPLGLRTPSRGDLSQARDLLEAWQRLGEASPWLLSFIVQEAPWAEQAVHPYWLAEPEGEFQPLRLKVIPDGDTQIHQALQAEPACLPACRQDHPWLDPGFCFQETPAGRLRLEIELKSLKKAGYQVQVRQKKSSRRVSFWISGGGLELLCAFPVEYPLGPPSFYRLPEGEEIYPLAGRAWNSDRCGWDCLAGVGCPAGLGSQADPTRPEQQGIIGPANGKLLPSGDIRGDSLLPAVVLGGLTGLAAGVYLTRRRSRKHA
jgi:proteasome lid subunit RPN8/RPN11